MANPPKLGQPAGIGANSYTKYEQDHHYQYDNGLVVLPVAGRTPAHRIIRLHGGLGIRNVTFEAQRRGKPPLVPTMTDLPYDTFIGGTITTDLPHPDPQSVGYMWRVTGEYQYVQTTPRVAGTNTFPTGNYPFPIAPNDTLGGAIISPYTGVFLSTDPNTSNPYDAMSISLGEGVVDHDSDSYLWPFTVLPPIFTSDSLLGA